jgi:histidine triad (HIT) family protein
MPLTACHEATCRSDNGALEQLQREAPMADTVFGRIVRGQIPCHKVYEDDQVLAFLDINPLSAGHTLVIPKESAETMDRLSDEAAAALGRVLPRICRAVIAATGVREYNVLENNGTGAHQAIPHVHFHIIPKPNAREGLGVGWPMRSLDSGVAAELAAKIAAAIA